MTAKLEKLMKQVEEEKARIKAEQAAQEAKQITAVSKLVARSGIAGLPVDFLQRSFEKIKADFEENHRQHVADLNAQEGGE